MLQGFTDIYEVIDDSKDIKEAFDAITESLNGLEIDDAVKKLHNLKLNPEMSAQILESAKSADILKGTTEEIEDGIKKVGQSSSYIDDLALGFKGLWATLATNPLTWIVVGIAGFSALIKVIDTYIGKQEKLARTKLEGLNEDITTYDEEIQSLEALQTKLESAKGNKSELAKIQNELNDAIGETTGLLNGEGKAYEIANAKLKANIELKKQQRQQAAKDKVSASKDLFDGNVYEADWDFDVTGDQMRTVTKEYQKYLKEYETLSKKDKEFWKKLDIESAEDYAFKAIKDKGIDLGGGTTRVFSFDKSDWTDYWNEQVQTAYDVFDEVIQDYDGVGGQDFIKNLIDNMVRSGSDLSEIGSIITQVTENPELQEAINSYWESLVNPDIDSEKALNAVKTMIDGIIKQYPQLETFFNDFYSGIISGAKAVATTVPNVTNSVANSRAEMISALNNMSEGFEELDKIYSSIQDEEPFDFKLLDDEKFKETFSGLGEVYEDFIEQVTSTPDDINACQSAFDNLVTEWINSTGVLDKVTDENALLTQSMLEQMGVSNAEEIVNSRLTAQKILEKNVITDLTDATLEEVDAQAKVIEQLLNEENASDATKAALIEIASSKHQCNTTGVVTDGDVKNLLALAEAAGIAGIEVANAKNSLDAIDSGANYRPEAANNALRADLYRRLQTQLKANYKNSYEPVKYNSTSSSNKSSSSGSSSSSSAKETEESFNWIERAIKKVQRTITNLGKTVSATWKSWTTRNKALKDQISAVNSEISTQQKAYDYYMKKANGVGLSKTYQELVKNGTIRIDTIKDENLIEKIKAYQDFYDQAIECKDAITDLQDELVELEMTKFDNTAKQFEDQISAIEHDVNMMESEIDLKNTAGYIEGRQAYSSLIQFQRENIALLQKEYSELNKQLNDLTKSGKITEFSEEWYDMMTDIQDVEESLIDANTALVEYQNTLRELDWDNFDMLQDRISQIIRESEFLRNLIGDEDMFNDNGSITRHGQATLGLHAVDYNTYMAQAKSYAEELLKIDKEIANDSNNQKLLERREELLQSQQDMITAAEGEKQAMQDLMREGYDTFLSYMDELISKRKDALKSIKDLYDYEKSISEQTQEISILEKQLISYQGDDSEETKSKIQQIKVSLEEARQNLEETEYDKYISDQEQMLDSLKEETELWVNSRLDNLDGLLQGVIDSTNANVTTIADTLRTEADAVSYNLTNSMQSIWNSDKVKDVVSMYGDNFNTHAITINSTLLAIKASVDTLFSGSTSVKKYATGGLVNETGFAWLDGTKDKPELVLNAQDTKNFMALAKTLRDVDPSELGLPSMEQVIASGLVTSSMSPILDSMKFKMPEMVSRNTNSQNSIVFNGDIILPDVQTPEEFARKIKEIYSNNTGNVRKVIQTDIYGGMLGKNSYEHRKYM